MTSDQICPLCGEKLVKHITLDYFSCVNQVNCHVSGIMWHNKESLDLLACQISRIKQEAKQEVFDDIEKERIRIGSSDETNCFMKLYPHDWKEIKKKHGVE